VVSDRKPLAVSGSHVAGEDGDGHSSAATVPVLELLERDSTCSPRERRLSWAELMTRVFEQDVLKCPKCGGRAKVVSIITQPGVIAAILACLGLSVRAQPIAPARRGNFVLGERVRGSSLGSCVSLATAAVVSAASWQFRPLQLALVPLCSPERQPPIARPCAKTQAILLMRPGIGPGP
jgi:hypothetical protein